MHRSRFYPSKRYLWASLAFAVVAAASAWVAREWFVGFYALAAFLGGLSIAALFMYFRPAIELTDEYVAVGDRMIPWEEIAAVEGTGWISPLVLSLRLEDGSRVTLVYPGILETKNELLRLLQRHMTENGVHQAGQATEARKLPSPRYRVVRPEDEDEVERLFHRLKTVGHLEQNNKTDEK